MAANSGATSRDEAMCVLAFVIVVVD